MSKKIEKNNRKNYNQQSLYIRTHTYLYILYYILLYNNVTPATTNENISIKAIVKKRRCNLSNNKTEMFCQKKVVLAFNFKQVLFQVEYGQLDA